LAPWHFQRRSSHSVAKMTLPDEERLASNPNLTTPELLDVIRWNIDRYDRLRSSTSSRASILLSANSVLLAGVVLLINYRLQTNYSHHLTYRDGILAATAILTATLIFMSIMKCINAIAARKTTRALHSREIPSRFLFNWGDTIGSVDGYSSFANKVTSLNHEDILGYAVAELWTDIIQHRDRHGYLRAGIGIFRYCTFSFLALAGSTLLAAA
jgi:hypothetical protein